MASARTVAALGLIATWSVAAANPELTLSPTEELTSVRAVTFSLNVGTSVVTEMNVGAAVGPIAGGSTQTFVSPPVPVDAPRYGFLAGRNAADDLVLFYSGPGLSSTFANQLPEAHYAGLKSFVTTGDGVALTALINDAIVPNGIFLQNRYETMTFYADVPTSGNLVKFSDSVATAQDMGTVAYDPVPEPASMAVLGLGLATLRRRRQSQRTA